MKTALSTPNSGPTTWDEAADEAVAAILGEYKPLVHDEGSLIRALRMRLDVLIENCFHADHSPRWLLTSLACYARDALVALGKMPTIEQIVRILADKQANYGTTNILTFGVKGIIIRVSDKVARIENMTANGRDDENEPLVDAYLDIIGYATIARMLENGTFELPLARDLPQGDPLDQALEDAFNKSGHIDTVAYLLGDVELDPELRPVIDALLATYVEAGKRIPLVLRYYYL